MYDTVKDQFPYWYICPFFYEKNNLLVPERYLISRKVCFFVFCFSNETRIKNNACNEKTSKEKYSKVLRSSEKCSWSVIVARARNRSGWVVDRAKSAISIQKTRRTKTTLARKTEILSVSNWPIIIFIFNVEQSPPQSRMFQRIEFEI